MSGESRGSRAAVELAEAQASRCPHCGRTSKTVEGVCADCWGVKDPDVAIDLGPPPRTEPLLGFGSDLDEFLGVGAVVAVPVFLGIVVAVLFLVVR